MVIKYFINAVLVIIVIIVRFFITSLEVIIIVIVIITDIFNLDFVSHPLLAYTFQIFHPFLIAKY